MTFNPVPYQGVFDATQYEPLAGGSRSLLDEGWYYAIVKSTEIKPTKANDGGFLALELDVAHVDTGASGEITQRLNLWSTSEKAQQIGHGQLSAICYVTGKHKLNMATAASELIGAKYRVFIKIKESQSNRIGATATDTFKSNEIGAIADVNGNAPGKAAPPAPSNAAPTGMQQSAPPVNQGPSGAAAGWSSGQPGMQAQQGGSWDGQPSQPEPQPQNSQWQQNSPPPAGQWGNQHQQGNPPPPPAAPGGMPWARG